MRPAVPTALLLALTAMLGAGCRSAAPIDPVVVDDARTAARVKTALVNDPDIGVRAIEVSVAGGVTRLSGRVRSQAEIERAVTIARAVPGVMRVESALRIAEDLEPDADAAETPPPGPSGADAIGEVDADPRLVAVGASMGWSRPTVDALQSRTTIGPLIRLGSGRGLGIAVGFDWFKSDFVTSDALAPSFARVTVRPVMAGLSYTFAAERVSVSPGIVAGVAFNSLSITDTGAATGPLAVEVDDSFVWRPGVSVWFDPSRRVAINVSAGYVFTGLDLIVLDAGRLSTRRVSGDTLMVRGGVAYKVF